MHSVGFLLPFSFQSTKYSHYNYSALSSLLPSFYWPFVSNFSTLLSLISLKFMALFILFMSPRGFCLYFKPNIEWIYNISSFCLIFYSMEKLNRSHQMKAFWSFLNIHTSHSTSRVVMHASVWGKSSHLSVGPIYSWTH